MTNFQNKIPAVQSGREIESSCFLRTFLGIDMTHSPIKRTGDVRGGGGKSRFRANSPFGPRPLLHDRSLPMGPETTGEFIRNFAPTSRTIEQKTKNKKAPCCACKQRRDLETDFHLMGRAK